MKFQNLNNVFTVFGNFLVFDDDTLPLINKVYADCNIQINQEPENSENSSGKVMVIIDPKKHMSITLRPSRIDIQLPGTLEENMNALLKDAQENFSKISEILENPLANRIAYVSNHFVFDDDGINTHEIIKQINFIPQNIKTSELSIRYNTPENVLGEGTNVVVSINDVLIGNNNNPNMGRRKSLMITLDINTIRQNDDERFNMKCLAAYYEAMLNLSKDRLAAF